MNTLHLTLMGHWYSMCEAGIKKHEYRAIKPYWCARLLLFDGKIMPKKFWVGYLSMHNGVINAMSGAVTFRHYDQIKAVNGYGNHRPHIIWKHEGTSIGKPNPDWCPPEDHGKILFILTIGEIIK